MKAITLLDACVKNVGNAFAREMSSKDFVGTFKQKYPKLQTTPRMKLIELTKQWAEDYKDNPEFRQVFTFLIF
ncbi:unnamed protein product [Hydatigera taeniaeformis]|uniref:VHS domain-containing protein n=1 Tax=Hydatigena taeniaeformis TaxID=6205 RepID=A0A0R3WTF7_HYDTA|nr:unnamed protein product [Hydatigera taeniaeformis]